MERMFPEASRVVSSPLVRHHARIPLRVRTLVVTISVVCRVVSSVLVYCEEMSAIEIE